MHPSSDVHTFPITRRQGAGLLEIPKEHPSHGKPGPHPCRLTTTLLWTTYPRRAPSPKAKIRTQIAEFAHLRPASLQDPLSREQNTPGISKNENGKSRPLARRRRPSHSSLSHQPGPIDRTLARQPLPRPVAPNSVYTMCPS